MGEEIEIKSQALAVLKQVIQEECKKIDDAEAEQTQVAPVAEDATVEAEPQASNDVPVKTDEKVEEEVKASSEDAPLKTDDNTTEAKTEAAADPKSKGKGKTNFMGGAR